MKATWLTAIARLIGFRRSTRALAQHPAWLDAACPSSPDHREARLATPTRSYSERERTAVWRKGRAMPGWDPEDWRVDHRGNPIFRHHYGDTESAFSWQVGRIAPDGGDELSNLRPELSGKCAPSTARFDRASDLARFAQ